MEASAVGVVTPFARARPVFFIDFLMESPPLFLEGKFLQLRDIELPPDASPRLVRDIRAEERPIFSEADSLMSPKTPPRSVEIFLPSSKTPFIRGILREPEACRLSWSSRLIRSSFDRSTTVVEPSSLVVPIG